jgi:Ca2+:H+ antiporter
VSRTSRALLGAIFAVTAVAGVLHYTNAPALPAFVISGLALAGIAWVVSFATEEVGDRFGPAVTGVLQSTLGNLPEFFVVIFALSAGEVVVAQFSIIGSIFANALLVLGFVIIVGAWKADDGVMRFSARLPMDTTTLLLLAGFIIVLVGLAGQTHDPAADDVGTISAIAAVLLLGTYVVWILGYLRSEGTGHEGPRAPAPDALPLSVSIGLLALGGAGAAFVSDWFIASLRPTIDEIGLSPQFAGLVIVAIAGNAVEHGVGVVLAARGEADLAISVVKNSVAQVAAFLWPALVLVSLLFTNHLTFDVAILYVGALFLTTISVWQVTGDGEATPFEGAALVATYIVLAVFTLYE